MKHLKIYTPFPSYSLQNSVESRPLKYYYCPFPSCSSAALSTISKPIVGACELHTSITDVVLVDYGSGPVLVAGEDGDVVFVNAVALGLGCGL